MKLIPNWKRAWRMLSVQIAAGIVAWTALPPDMQAAIVGALGIAPDRVPAILGVLLILGRLIEQPKIKPPEAGQ